MFSRLFYADLRSRLDWAVSRRWYQLRVSWHAWDKEPWLFALVLGLIATAFVFGLRAAYEQSLKPISLPGAVKIDWVTDLNDPVVRDYVDRARFERLLRAKGINKDTTVVFYGDKNNWWATYAFWVFKLFGVENIKLLDGGRLRWVDEGRELVTDAPSYAQGNISVRERDDSKIRAFRAEVQQHVNRSGKLVDVRSPEEYRGERLHMPEYPNEGAVRWTGRNCKACSISRDE